MLELTKAKQKMNVALIPARGGSKGIPKKNLRMMNGKPLIHWVVQAALGSTLDQVYVSTDSREIRECVNELKHPKLIIVGRSQETSTDNASTESVMLEFASKYEFENIALIQATSPMLTTDQINKAFDLYFNEKVDSLLTCVRQKRFLWELKDDYYSPVNYDYNNRPRRQDFEGFLVENGALYITSKSQLISTKSRISGNIRIYEMPLETYHEIDEVLDWATVQQLMIEKAY